MVKGRVFLAVLLSMLNSSCASLAPSLHPGEVGRRGGALFIKQQDLQEASELISFRTMYKTLSKLVGIAYIYTQSTNNGNCKFCDLQQKEQRETGNKFGDF